MAGDPSGEQRQSTFQRVLSNIDVWLQNASYGIVNHFLWKTLIVLFTIVLLLGRPCQFWFLPAAGDVALDTLHLVGFSIFTMDLVFHCYLDPLYYPWISFRCGKNNRRSSMTLQQQRRRCFPCIYLGSFNFWCDLASTICFLLEVSFFFPTRFGRSTIVIVLNENGFPVSELYASIVNGAT